MLGTTLHSHYKIVKVLGIGKSGATYLATDLDLINSPFYVVKKIQNADPLLLPPLAEKLFEIQGSIADRVGKHLQIPSLVAKFSENGNRYLVREYIEGELLSQELISCSTWSQTQVFDFLTDLVGILGFVHGCKYIHQDINPDNIIRGNDCRFNLIGFGSIKDLTSTWQNLQNRNPQRLNHSIYSPYEQEQNGTQPNTDLYAVGVIAIQALIGKIPTEKDPNSYELKWRDEVNIDDRLTKIIDRMVRPDYRNRYRSAVEVLEDLQSFALTQIPASKPRQLRSYLLFGTAVCTLLMGITLTKIFSASSTVEMVRLHSPQVASPGENPPQLSPSSRSTSNLSVNISDRLTWQNYLDKTTGIKIEYLPNWHQEDVRNVVTGENAIFTSPKQNVVDKYLENVSIRVENLTNAETTLSNYTKSAIAEIKKYYRDAKIIESSSTILANKSAILVVYTGKDENSLPIKNLEVWTIDRGKAYILTYKAEPDRYYQFLETAMTMINSFELQ